MGFFSNRATTSFVHAYGKRSPTGKPLGLPQKAAQMQLAARAGRLAQQAEQASRRLLLWVLLQDEDQKKTRATGKENAVSPSLFAIFFLVPSS